MTQVLAVRVDNETRREVEALAEARGVMLSEVLRDALTRTLDEARGVELPKTRPNTRKGRKR